MAAMTHFPETLEISIPRLQEKKWEISEWYMDIYLVGGFNPSEKYWSNWIISSSRGENKQYLKPPPSYGYVYFYLDLARGAEWMVKGAEKHHPLGFKQHPLEDAGIYVWFVCQNVVSKSSTSLRLFNKSLYSRNWSLLRFSQTGSIFSIYFGIISSEN